MRIILGVVLLAQAYLFWSYRDLLLNPAGPVPWAISDSWVDPLLPKLSSLVPLFEAMGLGPRAVVPVVVALHALAAAFLAIGYRTRLSVVVAWATFVLIRNSSTPWTYGLGPVILIALFYGLFMPIGREWSVDRALAGAKRDPPPVDPAPLIAVLRIHLCIVYAASGFAKAMGDQWWSGEAIWRALSLPQFRQFDPSALLSVPVALQLAAIGTILSQLAYPVLVWTRLRVVIVLLTELMHLGIAIFLGMWLFSAMMIALNTAAFGEAMWAAMAGRTRRETGPAPPGAGTLRVIYDGACPFCDDYVRYQRLRASVGTLELVDARTRPEALAAYSIDPGDLEDGFVVVSDRGRFVGAAAMHLLASLTDPPGKPWVRLVAALSRRQPVATLLYPFLVLGRRIALAILGVPRFPRS